MRSAFSIKWTFGEMSFRRFFLEEMIFRRNVLLPLYAYEIVQARQAGMPFNLVSIDFIAELKYTAI